MRSEEVAALPSRPDSIGDWEDLLVRLEIAPRVVRNTIEDLRNEANAAATLARATQREAEVGHWLETAARLDGRARPSPADPVAGSAELALRFASLRARTFAMVQRRGLEVWDWEAPLDGASVTAHQLLLWLSRRDAALLSDLRDATSPSLSGC